MALELLLPLLLDGDPSQHKLTSAARTRGGLFDRVMTGTDESTRTGFAWVEFTRGDETFTAGARIRASQASRLAKVDRFTTTLGVGRELHLLDANREALSRKALVDALGDAGRVHTSGDEHRTAVRDPVPRLLVRPLRLGHLSPGPAQGEAVPHLDLAKLSGTLSESLPPIDDHDVAAVAEGFERLDPAPERAGGAGGGEGGGAPAGPRPRRVRPGCGGGRGRRRAGGGDAPRCRHPR